MKTILSACALITISATVAAAETSAGSGVVIGTQGEILTNAHVVEDCQKITVQFSSQDSEVAVLIARDQKNDLALIKTGKLSASIAAFREGAPVRPGDSVVVLGYPLSGLLASTVNVSVGNANALAGLGDDSRYLQISAPVQPGNSGGPLLDTSGHLIGVVTSKLDPIRYAKITGDIPQNVNFALKAEVARTFLDSKSIAYRTARSEQSLSPPDVGDIARPFTVHIQCQRDTQRVAVASPIPKPPSTNTSPPQQVARCAPNASPEETIEACTALIQSAGIGINLFTVYGTRGNAYYQKNDYDHAISDATEAIRLNPKSAVAYTNRSLFYAGKKDYDHAISDASEAIRLDPKPAMAYNNRALAYAGKKDYDHSISDSTEAIRLNPNYASAYNNRGFIFYYKTDYDRAIADLNEAIRLDPKYAQAYNNRANAYRTKGDYDRAIADYSEVIRLYPKHAEAYSNRANSYRSNGDNDRAIADYSEVIRLDPKSAITYTMHRAKAYEAKGDYDNAIADYTEAIRLSTLMPTTAAFYNNRGNAYRAKGNYDRAIADYSEVIRLYPKHAEAYSNRANSYRAKGNYDRAISDLTEAIRLTPQNVDLLYKRGFAHFNKEDFGAAVIDFSQSIKLKDIAYPMLWRFLSRGRAGEPGETELASGAVQITPDKWPYPVIEFYLGKRSAPQMLAAATNPDENCEAQFYLGEWHLLRGNRAAAVTALRLAVNTCPKTFYEYDQAVVELKRMNQHATRAE